MKHFFWLLFLVPFISFTQQRTKIETNVNLLVDSLRNQILHITKDSLIRLDVTNLEVVEGRKILKPKTLVSLYPIIKENKLLFLDGKGGDVFELTEKDSLVRIDNSNIKNFLIGSSVFIRNDTLIRHGGYGYWSQSNFFTYLEKHTKEWEIYPISNTSIKSSTAHFHLAIDTGNKFYFFGGYSLSHNGSRQISPNNEVWSFNFQSKDWDFLGESKVDFLGVNSESFIDGKLMYILEEPGGLHRVDIEKNELTEFKANPILYLFKDDVDPVLYKGNLYFLTNKGKVRKVALKAITNKILKTTSFYKKENSYNYFLKSLGVVFLCFSFFAGYKYLKPINSIVVLENGLKYKSKFIELDNSAISILKIALKKEVEFSEINKLVRKEHLSKIQNERRRNQYIEQINLKIKVLTGCENDFLIISKSSFDARYKSVVLNNSDYGKFL